ncbi:MAG TPA: sugar ABC transporter permease YjfF [Firmicutes bacterium]|nr:sugar ABC transporter permease YjfF [Bacillota bacterium]
MKQKHIPIAATIAVTVLLYLIAALRFPGILSMRVLLNLFYDNSFLGICAVGMTFVILTGGIDLSVGAVVACTSVAIALFVRDFHMHPAMAALILMCIGTVYGILVGCLIHFFDIPPFLVTLAGMFFARGFCFVLSIDSIPINHPFFLKLSNIAIPILDGSLAVPSIIFIVILIAGIFIANRTRFGRNVYAVGGNMQSATLMGLESGKTLIGVYAFSGFCSALAGAVYALYTFSGNGWAANGMELDTIAAVVMGGTLLTGGVGSVFGTLFGVLISGVIQTYISFDGTLSAWWTKIVIGILLFTFILLQRFLYKTSRFTSNTAQVSFDVPEDKTAESI